MKGNEAVLDAVSKSRVKTMTKVHVHLGKGISVGGKRKYKLFLSNADSAKPKKMESNSQLIHFEYTQRFRRMDISPIPSSKEIYVYRMIL